MKKHLLCAALFTLFSSSQGVDRNQNPMNRDQDLEQMALGVGIRLVMSEELTTNLKQDPSYHALSLFDIGRIFGSKPPRWKKLIIDDWKYDPNSGDTQSLSFQEALGWLDGRPFQVLKGSSSILREYLEEKETTTKMFLDTVVIELFRREELLDRFLFSYRFNKLSPGFVKQFINKSEESLKNDEKKVFDFLQKYKKLTLIGSNLYEGRRSSFFLFIF